MTDRTLDTLTVEGFKSIGERRSIAVRPITILAGANSSGKSSFMQPFLLLKQTLDSTSDPGGVLLDGPNVRFSRVDQMLSRNQAGAVAKRIRVGAGAFYVSGFYGDDDPDHSSEEVSLTFAPGTQGAGLRLSAMDIEGDEYPTPVHLSADSSQKELELAAPSMIPRFEALDDLRRYSVWRIAADRGFYTIEIGFPPGILGKDFSRSIGEQPAPWFRSALERMIHLPGLRGNPQREYPRRAHGPRFEGTFDAYVASILAHWQSEPEACAEQRDQLARFLATLGLAWNVDVTAVDDTRLEIKVGRLSGGNGAADRVSIADVGFGVSQCLPVVVALVVAEPGQLVYLEQPEIHLHPRAQLNLARLLAETARQKKTIILETHSAILVRSIQTLVAQGEIVPDDVALHWFERDATGQTNISSAELDEDGAYGNWPEDFDATEAEVDNAYLDAVEQRHVNGR